MFRTSNTRGKQRFNFFQSFAGTKNDKLKLTKNQIKLIEDSNAIILAEKIELLLVSLGNKLTTELYMKVQQGYKWSDKEQKEIPNQKDLKAITQLLDQLPFKYFEDTLPKNNRQNGKLQKFVWYQVSVNEAVSHFMKEYADDLTEFEEGVLYGFPLSAIRAFSGLIKPNHDKPTAASVNLAGVCSADFWEDEQEYYGLWWERLRMLSPKIVAEAEKDCLEQT